MNGIKGLRNSLAGADVATCRREAEAGRGPGCERWKGDSC